MLAEQLPTLVQMPMRTLLKAPQVRLRSVRRPFTPATGASGAYTLPKGLQDRLTALLAPFRNRDAAFALAVFLARFWSSPARITMAFPVDRRALAERALSLELTEAQVRGGVRTLERIGFLDRAVPVSGSRYKATPEGLQRRPVLWHFGSDFAPAFLAANKRAQTAQEPRARVQRPQGASVNGRPSTRLLAHPGAISPKDMSKAKSVVFMGDVAKGSPGGRSPTPTEANPALEAALDRLMRGLRSEAPATAVNATLIPGTDGGA